MKIKKIASKICAFLLTSAMVFSSLNASALLDNAFAGEQRSVNLSVDTKETTAVKNPYGDDVICDVIFATPDEMSTQAKIDSCTEAKVVVKLTVNNFTAGAKAPSAYLYSMSKDWDHSWTSYSSQQLAKNQQITLEADLKNNMKWESSSELGKLGIRFVDCAENSALDYSIDSAQFVYTEGEGGSQNTPSTPSNITSDWAVEDTNVVLAVSNVDEYDFTSYFFTVKNVGSSSVNGNLVVTFDQNRTKNWWDGETAISLASNKLTISNINLSAGSSTKSIQVQLRPQGAKITNVTFNGKAIGISENASTSDVELKYELTGTTKELAASDTPFGKHGKLKLKKVSGYGNAPIIVDANEKPFMLQGASTHGMHWENEGGVFVNEGSFHSLRDEFGVNMVRLVNYVTQDGYTQGAASTLDSKIETGMTAAKKLGLYAIIDWHIHAENPHTTKEAAKAFWAKYAQKYKDENYVIYEICNEPTGVPWYTNGRDDLYGYCQEIIDVIRKYDSDAIIVCGTNTWSQDVKDVAGHDFNENGYNNIMYTLHFYSATHGAASSGNYERKLGPEMEQAIAAGTPIFITEFGVCSADGNGTYDTANADAWMALCDKYNISHACWALSNKGEAASYFKTSCSKKSGGWVASDLTTTGAWLINTYRDHAEKDNESGSAIEKPGTSSSSKGPGATEGIKRSSSSSSTKTTSSSSSTKTTSSSSSTKTTSSSSSAKTTSSSSSTKTTSSSSSTKTTSSSSSAKTTSSSSSEAKDISSSSSEVKDTSSSSSEAKDTSSSSSEAKDTSSSSTKTTSSSSSEVKNTSSSSSEVKDTSSSSSTKTTSSSSSTKTTSSSSSTKTTSSSSSTKTTSSSSSTKTTSSSSSEAKDTSSSSSEAKDTSSSSSDEKNTSSSSSDEKDTSSSSSDEKDTSSSSSEVKDTSSSSSEAKDTSSSSSDEKDTSSSSSDEKDTSSSSSEVKDTSSSSSEVKDTSSSSSDEKNTSSSSSEAKDTSSSSKHGNKKPDKTSSSDAAAAGSDIENGKADINLPENIMPTVEYAGEGETKVKIVCSIPALAYTGKKLTPAVNITLDESGTQLMEKRDYRVKYKNNKNANMAYDKATGTFENAVDDNRHPMMVISFRGAYKSLGTIEQEFDIYPTSIENAILIPKSKTLSGKQGAKIKFLKGASINLQGATKKINIKKELAAYYLVSVDNPDQRYDVEASANAPSGRYYIEAEGTGNFCGVKVSPEISLIRMSK